MLPLSATRVSVMGLEPNSRYKLFVHALNGVSEMSRTNKASFVVAETDKAGEHFRTSTQAIILQPFIPIESHHMDPPPT